MKYLRINNCFIRCLCWLAAVLVAAGTAFSQAALTSAPSGSLRTLPVVSKLTEVKPSESDRHDPLVPPAAIEKPSYPETVVRVADDDVEVDDADEGELPVEERWQPFAGLVREKHFGFTQPEPETWNVPVNPKFDDPKATPADPDNFHWKKAIYQSLMIQAVQHSYALVFQEKTRRALKGPFFSDYWESIKATRGWSDGNKFFTNYIAHPMQGAMTGFIFRQNHERVKRQKFGESKTYWKDRMIALAWSAAWSTNWEFGPISQSSIGNVGLYGHQGWVDTVITPTVGTGWMISEEALDRYVIARIEKSNFFLKIFFRSVLNPMRSVANLLQFKQPWYREPELR